VIKKHQIESLLEAIEAGNNVTDACILAKISRVTYHTWVKEKEGFEDQVLLAEVKCKNKHMKVIQDAAQKTWQAAAWWLERKHKSEYALRQEVTGKDGKDLPKQIYRLSDGTEIEF